jgi:hypothetical protein
MHACKLVNGGLDALLYTHCNTLFCAGRVLPIPVHGTLQRANQPLPQAATTAARAQRPVPSAGAAPGATAWMSLIEREMVTSNDKPRIVAHRYIFD